MSSWTVMNDLATGDLVTEADMDAIRGNIEYLMNPNRATLLDTGGDLTTTSLAFVDVHSRLTLSLETYGGPVLFTAGLTAMQSSAGQYINVDVVVDGVSLAGTSGGITALKFAAASHPTPVTLALFIPGLAAGTHTFKLRWKVNAGTGTIMAHSSSYAINLTAIEL